MAEEDVDRIAADIREAGLGARPSRFLTRNSPDRDEFRITATIHEVRRPAADAAITAAVSEAWHLVMDACGDGVGPLGASWLGAYAERVAWARHEASERERRAWALHEGLPMLLSGLALPDSAARDPYAREHVDQTHATASAIRGALVIAGLAAGDPRQACRDIMPIADGPLKRYEDATEAVLTRLSYQHAGDEDHRDDHQTPIEASLAARMEAASARAGLGGAVEPEDVYRGSHGDR